MLTYLYSDNSIFLIHINELMNKNCWRIYPGYYFRNAKNTWYHLDPEFAAVKRVRYIGERNILEEACGID